MVLALISMEAFIWLEKIKIKVVGKSVKDMLKKC